MVMDSTIRSEENKDREKDSITTLQCNGNNNIENMLTRSIATFYPDVERKDTDDTTRRAKRQKQSFSHFNSSEEHGNICGKLTDKNNERNSLPKFDGTLSARKSFTGLQKINQRNNDNMAYQLNDENLEIMMTCSIAKIYPNDGRKNTDDTSRRAKRRKQTDKHFNSSQEDGSFCCKVNDEQTECDSLPESLKTSSVTILSEGLTKTNRKNHDKATSNDLLTDVKKCDCSNIVSTDNLNYFKGKQRLAGRRCKKCDRELTVCFMREAKEAYYCSSIGDIRVGYATCDTVYCKPCHFPFLDGRNLQARKQKTRRDLQNRNIGSYNNLNDSPDVEDVNRKLNT